MREVPHDIQSRFLFWVAFSAFTIAACWTGHHHFFGVGYFRPVLATETRIFDIGEVLPDAVVEVELTITNGGWRSLQVAGVRTGCASCIRIVSFPTEPLRRNGTGQIRITFDSKSLSGKVRRSILILSNDPVHPVYSIMVDAVVRCEKEKEANGNE